MSRADERFRERHAGFHRLLGNPCHSEIDPIPEDVPRRYQDR